MIHFILNYLRFVSAVFLCVLSKIHIEILNLNISIARSFAYTGKRQTTLLCFIWLAFLSNNRIYHNPSLHSTHLPIVQEF